MNIKNVKKGKFPKMVPPSHVKGMDYDEREITRDSLIKVEKDYAIKLFDMKMSGKITEKQYDASIKRVNKHLEHYGSSMRY